MILDDIVRQVAVRLAGRKKAVPLGELEDRAKKRRPALDFAGALQRQGDEKVRVIAEVKKASPSKGVIRHDFDPVRIAVDYEACGASAISVLTEEDFFLGHPEFLRKIREAVGLPLLRKDFIVEAYQVVEARALGADAFLLIAALLTDEELKELIRVGREWGMTPLVEVHGEAELNRVLKLPARVIGINNRDLGTFVTDVEQTFRLMPRIPPGKIIVSESGIESSGDLKKCRRAKVDAVLVGEVLMRSPRPGEKLKQLLDH